MAALVRYLERNGGFDLGPFAPARRGATEAVRSDLPDMTLADLREMRKGVL